MYVNIHKIGDPSQEANQIVSKLTRALEKVIGLPDDLIVTRVVKGFDKSMKILPKKYPGFRMDGFFPNQNGGIGIVCVIGNKSNIAARCFSSLYSINQNEIKEQIFICQSPANAWARGNKKRKPQNNTGNRLTSAELRKFVDEIYPSLLSVPVTIIALTDSDAWENYSKYKASIGETPEKPFE